MYNLRCLSYYQSFIAADHCRIMGNEFQIFYTFAIYILCNVCYYTCTTPSYPIPFFVGASTFAFGTCVSGSQAARSFFKQSCVRPALAGFLLYEIRFGCLHNSLILINALQKQSHLFFYLFSSIFYPKTAIKRKTKERKKEK